jgi:two-component system response regulator ArlR
MKLLLAEDEQAMAEAVADVLEYHGYLVDTVSNGLEALDYATNESYDGIVMDIMMPKLDGLEALRRMRKKGVTAPVLLLTARAQVEERIEGLDAGADDYLPKPFAMGELLARVRTMLRRREEYIPDILEFGNISLDCAAKTLAGPRGGFSPTRLEYRLLELFLRSPGSVFSTETIMSRVWGYDSDADTATVWTTISNLRKKLEAAGANVKISSKRAVGYTLEVCHD